MKFLISTALGAWLLIASPVLAQDVDRPIATASSGEDRDALRMREAVAYSTQLPPDAPREDYPFVAWCAALVEGHVATGESLGGADALDREIVRLGRLEATDFRTALAVAEPRASVAMKQAAENAAASASAKWAPVLANPDEAVRSQVFGLFMGLPGRCEHAARRIRENVSTAPATLADVGLEDQAESAR